jgi:predicted DNA-binding protein YlxM (UPF0122 family)
MKTGIIYKAIFPSGKVYIGQTTVNFEERIRAHLYGAFNKNYSTFNTKMSRAIRKYKNKIIWEIIHADVPIKKLNVLEMEEIRLHDSFKKGYNSDLGGGCKRGEASSNAKLNEKIVKKIRMLYNTGKYTYAAIADLIGNIVNKQAIAKIVENIRWHDDKFTSIKFAQKGERNSQAKLTLNDIEEIRNIYAKGNISHKQIADKYGVQTPAIYKIINNLSWYDEKYSPPVFDSIIKKNKTARKLSYEIAEEIRQEFKSNNYTIKTLANKYSVSITTIRMILLNRIWKKI